MKTFAVIAVTMALACSSFALAQEMRKPGEAGPSLWDRSYKEYWEMSEDRLNTLTIMRWCLMVPPSTNIIGIPVANWQRRAVFDTKAQCQSARLKLIEHPPVGKSDHAWNPRRCVSSDDHRLAR